MQSLLTKTRICCSDLRRDFPKTVKDLKAHSVMLQKRKKGKPHEKDSRGDVIPEPNEV